MPRQDATTQGLTGHARRSQKSYSRRDVMTPGTAHDIVTGQGQRTPRGDTRGRGTSQEEWTPVHTDAGEGARDGHGHPNGTRDPCDSWVLIPALDEERYQS